MATPSKYGSSHINLALDTAQALFTRQVPYNAEVIGLVGSPAIGSVQATLDGRILSEEELDAVESEVHGKAPCTKQCWEATEERCVCRCGGLNHGRAWRNNASLEAFDSESAPVMSRDIVKGKLELLWLARKEVVAAYSAFLGGLK
jgi:hypothetical protein